MAIPGRRLLVVEDEPLLASLVAEALPGAGIHVEPQVEQEDVRVLHQR